MAPVETHTVLNFLERRTEEAVPWVLNEESSLFQTRLVDVGVAPVSLRAFLTGTVPGQLDVLPRILAASSFE